jgi:hypothetical protein
MVGIDLELNLFAEFKDSLKYFNNMNDKPYDLEKPHTILIGKNDPFDPFYSSENNYPREMPMDIVISMIADCQWHTFIILTKETKSMKLYFDNLKNNKFGYNYKNLWLGFDFDINSEDYLNMPYFLNIPTTNKFIYKNKKILLLDNETQTYFEMHEDFDFKWNKDKIVLTESDVVYKKDKDVLLIPFITKTKKTIKDSWFNEPEPGIIIERSIGKKYDCYKIEIHDFSKRNLTKVKQVLYLYDLSRVVYHLFGKII